MIIQVDLAVLALSIVAILGAIFLVMAIGVLIKLNDILRRSKDIFIKNEGNINASLEELPKVLHNLEEITNNVNEEVKNLQGVVKNIEETVEYAAATAQVLSEDIVEPIFNVLQLLDFIKGIFVKEKKKGWLGK